MLIGFTSPLKALHLSDRRSHADRRAEERDQAAQFAAINKVLAVIEFSTDGRVLTANENFLALLGYSLDEVRGQHHSMFVDPAARNTVEYRLFWEKLGRGEFDAGQYKRIGKGGKEVWIQASYNPILDLGKVTKVVKFATDITAERLTAADAAGQLAAISKSQGVIEFGLDGKVLTANENFLAVLGYSLAEVRGQHHSTFVDPVARASVEYRLFWEKLGRGEYDAGLYKRIGKGGKEVWIQASYNPILDLNGKPFKVVKYATDVTVEKLAAADAAGQLTAIGKSQAVIEFGLDGRVLTANENFLAVLGYALAEVRGQHHSMFVDPVYRSSPEYRLFWDKLGRGEFDAGEYKRIGKGGKEVWIQASYNPILDLNGKPFKVVKYATNVTAQKLTAADAAGQTGGDRQVAGRHRIRPRRPGADRERELPGTARLQRRGNPRPSSQHVRRARLCQQPGVPAILGETGARRVRCGPVQAARQGGPGGLDPGQLQSDPRSQQQAVQGGEIRHRHHRAGARRRRGARGGATGAGGGGGGARQRSHQAGAAGRQVRRPRDPVRRRQRAAGNHGVDRRAPSRTPPPPSPPPRARSPRATPTCRSAPKNRPPAWRKRRQASRS